MASNKLYRSFIILQEDERGHSVSNDKPLSGYTKIEAKGDKCKIAFYAQNLKLANEKCHMAVVCNKKEGNYILDLGLMNIDSQGKVEASLEYSTNNIGNLDVSYDKIIGAVIYKEVAGKVVFIMCGFLNGQQPKDNWKIYKIVYNKTAKKSIKSNQDDDKKEKDKDKHKKNITNNEQVEKDNNTRSDNSIEVIEVKEVENNDDIESNLDESSRESNIFDEYEATIEARINGGNYEREADDDYSEVETRRVVEEIKLQAEAPENNENEVVTEPVRQIETFRSQQVESPTRTIDWQAQPTGTFGAQQVQSSTGTMTGQMQPTGTLGAGQSQSSTGTMTGQMQPTGTFGVGQSQSSTGTMTGQMQPTGTFGVGQGQSVTGVETGQTQSQVPMTEKQAQQAGIMHGGYMDWNYIDNTSMKQRFRSENDDLEDIDNVELTGVTGEFFSSVVSDFEYSRDFAKDIKNCKWYKVKVDDFDVLCNMSNYNKYTVAYYPMISYYPYISKKGYFMIGFKHDENGVVKYVTYAIPGCKDRNHQPYGGKTGFVTWCPEFKNSDNGHWIMFYDFQTCKVLIPVNK